MSFKVQDFPIFHRYLASILLKVKLADGTYSHILKTVGEYSVTGRCECGEDTCNTMYMKSDSLVGKDGAFAHAFTTCWIVINFYPDGIMEIENLAGNQDCNFPFKQEILDVFAGIELGYDSSDAEKIVEEFMSKLKRQEVQKIEV